MGLGEEELRLGLLGRSMLRSAIDVMVVCTKP
jgi:hypothetical protein